MDEDVAMKIPPETPKLQYQTSIKSLSKSIISEECDSFNRVHQILDSLHRSQVTRIMFTKMQMTNTEDIIKPDAESRFCIVSSSLDGKISIASLESENGNLSSSILPHPGNTKFFDESSIQLLTCSLSYSPHNPSWNVE